MLDRVVSFLKNDFELDFRFLAGIAIVLLVYTQLVDDLYFRLGSSSFRDAFYSHNTVLRIPWFFGLVLLLFILNRIPHAKNPLFRQYSWQAIDARGLLRLAVVAVVFMMTWAFAAYEYNYFYDQPHTMDRLLLLITALLTILSPLFVGPFAVMCYATTSQLSYPGVLSISYTDKFLIFEFLLLFALFAYIRPFIRAKKSLFVFLALVLIGSYYYAAGSRKLDLTYEGQLWMFSNQLHELFVSSYINGWLSFLPMQTALDLGKILEAVEVPLMVYTQIAELSGLVLILFRRRLAIVILLAEVLLHLGIYASSGIFFWKWIVLDLSMAYLLWRSSQDNEIQKVFRLPYGILSVLLIIFGNSFFSPRYLGWYDGPVNNFFEFEVEDTQGQIFEFSRSYLQPYDLRAAQSRFYSLVDEKLLFNTYGTIFNARAYFTLLEQGRPVYENLKETYGENQYSEADVTAFTSFVQRYFSSYNRRRGELFLPALLRPPLHIWTFPRPNAYNGNYPIQIVRIRFYETYYDGECIEILQDRVILETEIPESWGDP